MTDVRRIRITIEGIVQGVGFRPFVFRLAERHGITGWVKNTTAGVVMEAEGDAP
ncbi:partial acylphosphatase, partial [Geobacteraceae bacterium]